MPAASRITPQYLERGIPAAAGKNYGEAADPLCPGLRIRTTWPKQGARITRFYFRYRHRVTGKLKTTPVGRFPDVTLREARRIVEDELRPLADQGVDIAATERVMQTAAHEAQVAELEAEQARLVRVQVGRFLASEDFASRAPATQRSYRRYLEHTATAWASMSLEDVTRVQVREEFLRIRRTRGHRAAGHWLSANSAMWTWLCDDEVTDRHPFRGTGKMRREAAAQPSDRWLDEGEIVTFYRCLARFPADRALALKIMLATGLRPGEVLGGDWSELDKDARRWRIPAARMKDRRREHRVHVSDYVFGLLPSRWPASGPLFPSRSQAGRVQVSDLSHQTARLDLPDFSAKALRATAATHWRAMEIERQRDDGAIIVERIRPEVREAMLHHTEKNPLAAHYLHDDLWPAMVDAWEEWGRRLEALEGRALG